MKRSILYLIVALIFTVSGNLFSQGCQNIIKYPPNTVIAPGNYDTVLISDISYPGDYAVANEFIVGDTYVFTSDSINDVITLRSIDQSTVLAFGPQPLSYTITTDTAMNIHFNLPDCAIVSVARVTKIFKLIDEDNVGINVAEPLATLDVNGKIKVGDDLNFAVAGMVRYNEDLQDFEGYDGEKWRSFTKSPDMWGDVNVPTVTSSKCFQDDNGGEFDLLGTTMDIDGDYAAVSAYGQDIDWKVQEGSVYILKREGDSFVFHQKIVSPTGNNFNQYGQGGIDIKGDLMIIGTLNAHTNLIYGTAEIWKLTDGLWTWVKKIANPVENDFLFGRSVAINEQYAAVRNVHFADNANKVMVYKKVGNNWQLIETIDSPTNSGTFGASLEFYDNELYIGDPDYIGEEVIGGRVSIFGIDQDDNVMIEDSIENVGVNPNLNDGFGREIDIDSDKMIISSVKYEVDGVSRSGQAYIFAKESGIWVLEKTLQENPTTEGSDFGNSVSIYKDQALVTTSTFNGAVKAYVYKFEEDWELESILVSGDQAENDFFGVGAEITDDIIMIGASKTDIDGNQDQGKVYFFCK